MSNAFHEHDFLNSLLALPIDSRLIVPIGDDAALLEDRCGGILLAADTVAEGRHCERGPDAPEVLARKVVRANLSDLAAMGGYAESLLLNMILPEGVEPKIPQRILQVVSEECALFGVALAGGDTVCAGDRIILAASVTGRLFQQPICRSGAKLGDLIVVTGALGGSILGRHGTFIPRIKEAEILSRWGPPSAMADISDGFLRDLNNILVASGVGALLNEDQIPISEAASALAEMNPSRSPLDHALHDGEDFELVLTISPDRFEIVQENWKIDTKLHVTGAVVESGLSLLVGGEVQSVDPGGFDHGA